MGHSLMLELMWMHPLPAPGQTHHSLRQARCVTVRRAHPGRRPWPTGRASSPPRAAWPSAASRPRPGRAGRSSRLRARALLARSRRRLLLHAHQLQPSMSHAYQLQPSRSHAHPLQPPRSHAHQLQPSRLVLCCCRGLSCASRVSKLRWRRGREAAQHSTRLVRCLACGQARPAVQ